MSSSPETSKKLGQMLVEDGHITGEQLIRAIQSQRVVGGRIGTCLLEMDVLTEDKLLDALSRQLSVPAAHIDELRTINDVVLRMIPSKVASRWQAIPFFVDETAIHVATLNVKNLACLDEIEFCTNKRVTPHIANEVRIFEALEKYYSVECPKRYGHLLDRLNRSRYMWDESAKVLLGGGEAEWNDPIEMSPPPELDLRDSDLGGSNGAASEPGSSGANGSAPEARSTRVMSSPASRSTRSLGGSLPTEKPSPSDRPSAPITWPATDQGSPDRSPAATDGDHLDLPEILTLQDLEGLLAGQADHRSVGRLVLHYLTQVFSRCAIFAIKGEHVRGWLHHGESIDATLVRHLEIAFDQPSAFLSLAKGAEFFLGPLTPMPAHRLLASCWGGQLPDQCLLLPIRVRGRLISVIYGDNGSRGLVGVDVELLKEVAEKASIAFELCILRRKLHQRVKASGNGGTAA